MFQLTKLRKELQFNKEIGGIINVLKGVASSEFYRLQKARRRLDEFGDYLNDFLQMVDVTSLKHLFLEVSSLPQAILLITSDTGFLGELNTSVVNSALEQCSGNERLIIVGKQGARHIEESGKRFTPLDSKHLSGFTAFAGISDEVEYEEAQSLGSYIVRKFLDKKIGKTVVVYPHFLSFAEWEVQVYQLLPCRFLFREETEASETQSLGALERGGEVIVEPSLAKIIEYLVKVWVNYILYGIFWESKLSEWAARVIHLEGSSFEIKQMGKKLHLQYFRILHEISDKDIREVYASRLAVERAR